MTLHQLPPGLPPDEVEKLRWEAFGHKRANALTSADGLTRFIARRGFVLSRPQRGLQYPSALEAVLGRPLLGRSFDARGTQLETWRLQCMAARRVHAAAVLGGFASLAAPAFHSDFLALAERRDDLASLDPLRGRQGLGYDAAAVCQHLAAAKRALTLSELGESMQLRSEPGRVRVQAALTEAIRRMRVCEVVPDHATAPPVAAYDLVARTCSDVLQKACKTKPATARRRIATRYLRNVLVEGAHEMARVLGWSADETLETLRGLESRHIVSEHPASRHNRWFFQANATDLFTTA